METRQNAEELHRYLDFADITDWHNMKDTDFEKVNFGSSSSTHPDNVQKRLTDSKIYEEILSQEGNFSFASANMRSAAAARQSHKNNFFESTEQWMIHNPSPKRNNKQQSIKQLRTQTQ